MRRIAPIDLDGTVPADLTGQSAPDWDIVAPTDLYVEDDDGYQRSLTPQGLKKVRRTSGTWFWPKYKPPICARIDGKLCVIDGQHTAIAAASHGGIPLIPIVIVSAPEFVERARAFISHAVDRTPVTPGQIWHAAAAAGDEDAVAIRTACATARLHLLPFSPDRSAFKPRQTVAIATIQQIMKRRGAVRTADVLRAAADAEFAPISADHLKVAETLLCGDDYAGEFGVEAVTALLKGMGPRAHAEARELAIAKHLPMWRALTAVVYRSRDKRRARPVEPASTPASVASPETDSQPDRTPEKGAYQASAPSMARPLRDRDSIDAKPLVRRTVPVTAALCGDPPPGPLGA